MKMQIPRPTSSDLMPRFLSLLLEIAWPKTPARMGPISGETNILATRITAIDGKELESLNQRLGSLIIH